VRRLYLTACLCLLVGGCSKGPPDTQAIQENAPPHVHIDQLEPSYTSVATAFKALPDGTSQLVVFGSMSYGATVLWNGQPVESRGGGKAGFVLGLIPATLIPMVGTARVTVRDGDMVSNPLDFTIYGKTGPAPRINALAPAGAVAGQGFNVQPSGDSAVGVTGVGFLPGLSVVMDGKPMNATVFGHDNFISASIPSALIAKAGAHQVWVANPDKKISNKVEFKVTAN
jgi:hypothetical protein